MRYFLRSMLFYFVMNYEFVVEIISNRLSILVHHDDNFELSNQDNILVANEAT